MPRHHLIIRWFAVLVLTVLAVFYIDWSLVFASFNYSHLVAIVAVQPLQFLIIGFLAVRFSLLTQEHTKSFSHFYRGYLLSIGMNVFIPGKLSEVLKVSYLREYAEIPASRTISAVFLERITDVLILGIVVILGLGTIWIDINRNVVFLMLIALILFLVLLPKIELTLVHWLDHSSANRFITLFKDSLSEAAARIRGKSFFVAMGLGVASWLLSFLMTLTVLKIIHGANMSITDALLVFSAMALGRAIPGLPGGLGTFEAAVVLSMTHIGFGVSESVASALALHASQLVVVTIASLAIVGTSGTGLKTLLQAIVKKDTNE